MSGLLFSILTAYSFAGLVSGVALGPEWLRAPNAFGILHVTMLVPGAIFLGGALIFRLSLLHRGKADAICRFFSLLGWTAIFGAAAQSGVGWLGRWPEVQVLWVAHMAAQTFALALTALSIISTLLLAMASSLWVSVPASDGIGKRGTLGFMVPGLFMVLVASVTFVYLVVELAFGIVVGPEWTLTIVLLSAAALRIAAFTPHKRKEPAWQNEPTKKPS